MTATVNAPRVLTLAKDITARVRAGHPWIYRDALASGAAHAQATSGEVVEVRTRGGAPVARGFFDPDGPIAVRVLPADGVAPALGRALALRAAARARIDSDGVRLVHGEGDELPGLVVDAYAGVGVVRFDGDAAAAMWRPQLPLVCDAAAAAGYPLDAVWVRGQGRGASAGGAWFRGAAREIVIREGESLFEVDVVHGQKTGFFLDQRDNRRLVAALAGGATVLNLFGYTGGFSVAAGRAGAHAVTTVDIAGPAIAAARRNLTRNGLGPGHELVAEDVKTFLARARAAGRRWDIVVCDPPSFAPSARTLPAALVAYRELNRAAAAVVAQGGLLATASCSSHVTPAAFMEAVAAAVTDQPFPRVIHAGGAGVDHPTLPGFPEGRYLKFLLIAL